MITSVTIVSVAVVSMVVLVARTAVVLVLCGCVAEDACGGHACYGEAGIDGLPRSAIGVIGG